MESLHNTLVKPITQCRVCGSTELVDLFTVGDQTLTGVFIKPEQPDPIRVPLELCICSECKFLQLKNTVKPDLMYESYWYRSGTNQTMRDHLMGVVEDAKQRVQLNSNDIVVDIGCNDGTLLAAYGTGVKRIGVDPSDAILSIADNTIAKVNNYFTYANIQAALGSKKAKVITSISMFYDLDAPHRFVEDIQQALDADGTWIVEMNYTGDMINHLGYDMISHEHVAYYTLRTFRRLVYPHGLYVNDISFNGINGGSIRIFCSFKNSVSERVARVLEQEREQGLEEVETYHKYAKRIVEFKQTLRQLLESIRKKGGKVAAYGASTRGNTILQHCDIKRDMVFAAADRNPGKWGLESSGSRIPITSEKEVREARPDYMLVLPYYFLDEFIKRESEYLNAGGKFIIPLPKLRVLSKQGAEIKEEILADLSID